MSFYKHFVFENYNFDTESKKLTLNYSLDDLVSFTETYTFDFEFVAGLDETALDRAFQGLFFMAGVSYYKTYLPPEIIVRKGQIDSVLADFLSKTYQKGLGEFFYVNGLNPKTDIKFPVNSDNTESIQVASDNGFLVGLGGGKDSLVSAEVLRDYENTTTWSLNHASQLEPLVNKVGLPHIQVERIWDYSLLELNNKDAYNGHVPISAIFAFASVVVAILAGKKDVVVSNEHAANEPNLIYKDASINHQYSKSQEFEIDFQNYLKQSYGDNIRYYSSLRPFSELSIAKLFAGLCFEKYKDTFSSCNRAFTYASNHMSWCGECAKCAFTFLILSPFVNRGDLETMFSKNLLLEPSLEDIYRQLLGIKDNKPLDCVGEIAESRAAMKLAKEIYPELNKYEFEVTDFNPAKLHEHSMPSDIFEKFKSKLT